MFTPSHLYTVKEFIRNGFIFSFDIVALTGESELVINNANFC